MEKKSIESMLERVVAGDEAAWRVFVEKYFGFLLSLARRYARGDDDLAEELCVFALENLRKSGTDGATFARLRHYLDSRERFGGRGRFTTWLALVARNIFRDWFRSRLGRLKKPDGGVSGEPMRRWPVEYSPGKTRLDSDRIEDTSAGSRPDLALEMRAGMRSALRLGQAVRQEIERLPESARQVLLLHLVRGLEGEEIRRIMGFRVRQKVYDEISRAKRLLGRQIMKRGFTREDVAAALEHLADVFSESLFPDPAAGSVVNGQKPC